MDIDPITDARWNAFVTGHPGAAVYHLGEFAELLQRCYGFEPAYLGLEDDGGRIVGAMPVMRTRGLYRGTRVVSLPLAPRVGPLANTDEDAAILVRAACDMAEAAGTRLVMRTYQNGLEKLVPRLHARRFRSWVVPLPSDPDELRRMWRKSLRRNVVQSERAGLTVRDLTEERDLHRFYRLYCMTMKRKGIAPRPYRQMQLSWRILGPAGRVKVMLVERGGGLLAAGLLQLCGDCAEFLYIGSDPRHHNTHRPNHALYWNLQRWAIENGYRRFDTGGGDGELEAFKRGWAAEPVEWTSYVQTPADAVVRRQVEHGRTAWIWERWPRPLASPAGTLLYRYVADPSR